ncbi:hypothetical protein LTR85_007965 [Meristemomyces frigidus]|nr:hypothetical protein LTR85_007965 [Meristemomyces frigidus]
MIHDQRAGEHPILWRIQDSIEAGWEKAIIRPWKRLVARRAALRARWHAFVARGRFHMAVNLVVAHLPDDEWAALDAYADADRGPVEWDRYADEGLLTLEKVVALGTIVPCLADSSRGRRRMREHMRLAMAGRRAREDLRRAIAGRVRSGLAIARLEGQRRGPQVD